MGRFDSGVKERGGVRLGVRGPILAAVEEESRSNDRAGTGGTGGASRGVLPSRLCTIVLNSDMGRSSAKDVPGAPSRLGGPRRRRVRNSSWNCFRRWRD
jgi:hypothetical protein